MDFALFFEGEKYWIVKVDTTYARRKTGGIQYASFTMMDII